MSNILLSFFSVTKFFPVVGLYPMLLDYFPLYMGFASFRLHQGFAADIALYGGGGMGEHDLGVGAYVTLDH
jgi:hypothetical protein